VNPSSVPLVGGSGLVGTALLDRLLRRGHHVVVLDRRPPRRAVEWRDVDLLDAAAAARMAAVLRAAGSDVVVHLAARVDPPRDDAGRARMRRLHEHGTKATVDAARQAGVSRFVLVSSAVVYGAWPDQPVPLTEDAPVRPCDLPYAVDKARQESLVVEGWGAAPGLAIVRPAIVYAPHARSYLTEILRRARLPVPPGWRGPRGVLPALDGHRPPLQFVHVDDVAAVLEAVIARAAEGTFHACPDDWLPYDEVARLAGLAVVDVDARRIAGVLDAVLPWLPPSWRAPPALFPYLMHPFVLSSTKTAASLGVRPVHSSSTALRSMLGH
jgi:UDP-glucose 4-epimerase